MFLKGEKVLLRPPEKEQIELFLRWFNDLEVCRYLGRYWPISRPEEEEWFQNLHKRKEDVVFLIEANDEKRPIGSCGLHRINLANRAAMIGIVIGEKEYWGRGYGREAMNLLCAYGFNILNLNRIGLQVFEYNERGRRCYESIGFKVEGREREAKYWNGRYWDIFGMGLLRNEWNARRNGQAMALPEHLSKVE